jgi:hypothetical protein
MAGPNYRGASCLIENVFGASMKGLSAARETDFYDAVVAFTSPCQQHLPAALLPKSHHRIGERKTMPQAPRSVAIGLFHRLGCTRASPLSRPKGVGTCQCGVRRCADKHKAIFGIASFQVSSPLNRLKLPDRPPAPIGSTK